MKISLPCLALASLTLALAACAPAKPVTYANPDLALTVTYPGDWQAIGKDDIQAGVDQIKDKTQISTAGVPSALDHTVLAVAKKMKGNQDAPNLMVLSIPVGANECAALRDPRFREADAMMIAKQVPGARQSLSKHIPLAGIEGQTFELPVLGKTVLQHRYWYCNKGNAVLLQAGSSTPAGELEVKQVLQSVHVTAH